MAGAVERALRLDAACVVCNLLQLPDQPELFRQCVKNVSALRAACDPVGMPLMVEPLVMQPSEQGPTASTATWGGLCRSSGRQSS